MIGGRDKRDRDETPESLPEPRTDAGKRYLQGKPWLGETHRAILDIEDEASGSGRIVSSRRADPIVIDPDAFGPVHGASRVQS